jgi:hypothetical protein
VTASKPAGRAAVYRVGTGIGGRSDDRDVPVVAAGGFAATRGPPRLALSTDSR